MLYNLNGLAILYVRNDAVFCNYNVISFGNSEKKQNSFLCFVTFYVK